MSVEGKFADVARRDLIAVGERFDVPGTRSLLIEVGDAISSWGEFASQAGVSVSRAKGIGQRLHSLAF